MVFSFSRVLACSSAEFDVQLGNALLARIQFTIHTAEYTINQAEWDQLRPFYEALQKRTPYISVVRFTLTSAPNAPAKLTLLLKVVSFEIVP